MTATEHFDAIIVGAGAMGAVYAYELTKAGMKVLAVEKGKYFKDHKQDFVENELGMFPLIWDHSKYEISGGAFDGGPNLGANVGGGTLAWTATSLRMFERDFRFKSQWGVPAGSSVRDWPITKKILRPYYEKAEIQMGVSGVATPWDEEGDIPPPLPSLPLYRSSRVLERTFETLGMRHSPGRVATNSQSYDGRPKCLNCGFCRSGCRVDAKYQADEVMIKPALATGRLTLETESVVTRVNTRSEGRLAKSINYINLKTGTEHIATGKYVILCNNPIEVPRLLLSSTDKFHPNGIGNRLDQIGRNFYAHATCIGIGLTNTDLRSSIGHSMCNIMSLDTCLNTEFDNFAGGFSILSLHGAGAGAIAAYPLSKLNGRGLHERMRLFNNSLVMISFIEALPVEANRITVNRAKLDEFGMPVGVVNYAWHPNDLAAFEGAKKKLAKVLQTAGSQELFLSDIFESHPLGSMRMGNSPATSATDRFGRVHGVRNLYVGGGCLFVTGGSVNPTLTMHALALRSAKKIINNWLGRHMETDSHDD